MAEVKIKLDNFKAQPCKRTRSHGKTRFKDPAYKAYQATLTIRLLQSQLKNKMKREGLEPYSVTELVVIAHFPYPKWSKMKRMNHSEKFGNNVVIKHYGDGNNIWNAIADTLTDMQIIGDDGQLDCICKRRYTEEPMPYIEITLRGISFK